jgi:alpha-glucosidase
MKQKFQWWQTGIIYQIYPRSYQDSNNDGIGDLKGIAVRLDYIKSIGIKTIWLSPIYPSPMHDFGYDVTDYTDISTIFGSMKDFDILLKEIHKRDMKLILDLVPNHTSSEHKWFKESISSIDNPKRDWYIWRDPAPDGGPPNNWLSYFGGAAWEFDKKRGQYYLHLFVKQQPDLNYRNSEVRKAMLDIVRFWLDKGIDGFRVDVICCMGKDELFRNEPMNPNWDGIVPFNKHKHIYTTNLPFVHDIIKDMRKVIDEFGDRLMVGEAYLPYDQLIEYYGENHDECHMPFNFHLMEAKWSAETIRKLIDDYEAILPEGCWPNYVLGNHDQKRVATRVGQAQARIANMMLLTLRGTPTIYYGEEIGMHNGMIPPEFVQDPPAVNQPEIADKVGRDPERTPMQWDHTSNAGFSTKDVVTWLPVVEDYSKRNVAEQEKCHTSDLALFKALTALRHAESALTIGDYGSIDIKKNDIFVYKRTIVGEAIFLIVLNFGMKKHVLDLSYVALNANIAVASGMKRTGSVDLEELKIHPNEGLVLKI